MDIDKFKENIKTWDDSRLSNAYQTYCKRLMTQSTLKEELENIIDSIRDEWEERKIGRCRALSLRIGMFSTMGYKVGMEDIKKK